MSLFASFPADDRGEVISSWLVKLVVVLGVLGVMAFDAISVGMTHLRVQDAAASGARAAFEASSGRPDARVAYTAAQTAVTQDDPTYKVDPRSIRYDSTGAVSLAVTGTGNTIVLHYISPLEKYATVTSTETARPEAN